MLLEECARFIADRAVPLGRLITRRYPLEEAGTAYQEFEAGAPGKFVLVPPG